jgi:hypothetical protein
MGDVVARGEAVGRGYRVGCRDVFLWRAGVEEGRGSVCRVRVCRAGILPGGAGRKLRRGAAIFVIHQ